MRQLRVRILQNEKIAPSFYKMRLESSYLAKNSKPGQFVEVRCSGQLDPLLRRPLGVHRILTDGIELLYEVVGRGTEILSKRKLGEDLDIIGPLGNGFTLNQQTSKPANQQTILIAGGIGVAPLLALAESLFASSRVREFASLKVFIGACTKTHILCEKEFKKLGAEVLIATEDGSMGEKGLITALLEKDLSNSRTHELTNSRTIYACGPHGMLKEVVRIARSRNIPCQVSLEEHMACGVGVCLGCPVKVSQLASLPVNQFEPANRQMVRQAHHPSDHPEQGRGTGKPANYTYKMVCKDGPIFDAQEVVW